MLFAFAPVLAAAASSCKTVHNGDTSTSSSSGSSGGASSASGTGGAGTGGSGGGAGTAGATSSSSTGSNPDAGDAGDGDAGPPAVTGRSIFETTVLADTKDSSGNTVLGLKSVCYACHAQGGISDEPFLAKPDYYASIASFPGIIVPTVSQSILITHPNDPNHGAGQGAHLDGQLRTNVENWLQYEADHLPKGDGGPMLTPLKPYLQGAYNAIYLDPLGSDFANSSITFNAQEIGDPPILTLTNLQVHAISGVTLHIVHPLFTVYPAAGGEIPDPIDSFSGFDSTYTINTDYTLGTGTLILNDWSKDARLGISFEKLEATVDASALKQCKNVGLFQSTFVALLQNPNGLTPCATQCHGGANVAAQKQMDLSHLGDTPPDAACSQVLSRITPSDPTNSEILLVTDPSSGIPHLFKFKGMQSDYNTFKTAVLPWIMAEQ